MLIPFDVRDQNGRRGMYILIGSIVALLAIATVVFVTYQPGTRDRGEPPRIKADNQPFKIEPTDPGGVQTPDQDKSVYDVMAGKTVEETVVTVPGAEEPLDSNPWGFILFARGADPIISDRAFGRDAVSIISMAHAAMAGLVTGGVAPVIKHIPGHGRATVDSHKALPRISAKKMQLKITDFLPFEALSDAPMAMTAHAVYECSDRVSPVTISKKALTELIRGDIGFDGLLMSDDLDMRALHTGGMDGNLTVLTESALKAGCDIALQCSGKLPDMVKVALTAMKARFICCSNSRVSKKWTWHVFLFSRSQNNIWPSSRRLRIYALSLQRIISSWRHG